MSERDSQTNLTIQSAFLGAHLEAPITYSDVARVGETDAEFDFHFESSGDEVVCEWRAFEIGIDSRPWVDRPSVSPNATPMERSSRPETNAEGDDENLVLRDSWDAVFSQRAVSQSLCRDRPAACRALAGPDVEDYDSMYQLLAGGPTLRSVHVHLYGLEPNALYAIVLTVVPCTAVRCGGVDAARPYRRLLWFPLKTIGLTSYVRCTDRSDTMLRANITRRDNTVPTPGFVEALLTTTSQTSDQRLATPLGLAELLPLQGDEPTTPFGRSSSIIPVTEKRLEVVAACAKALRGTPLPSQVFQFRCRAFGMQPAVSPEFDVEEHEVTLGVGETFATFSQLHDETMYRLDILTIEHTMRTAPTASPDAPDGTCPPLPTEDDTQRNEGTAARGNDTTASQQLQQQHLTETSTSTCIYGRRSAPSYCATLPRVIALVESLTSGSASVSVSRETSPDSPASMVLATMTETQRLALLATGGADEIVAVVARIAKRRMAQLMSMRRGSSQIGKSRANSSQSRMSIGSRAESVLSDQQSEIFGKTMLSQSSGHAGAGGGGNSRVEDDDDDASDISSSGSDDDSDLDDDVSRANSSSTSKSGANSSAAKGGSQSRGGSRKGGNHDDDGDRRETGDIVIIGQFPPEHPFNIDGLTPNTAYSIHFYKHFMSPEEIETHRLRNAILNHRSGPESLSDGPSATSGELLAAAAALEDDAQMVEALVTSAEQQERRTIAVQKDAYMGRSLIVTPNLMKPLTMAMMADVSQGGKSSSVGGGRRASSGRRLSSLKSASISAAQSAANAQNNGGIEDGYIQNDVAVRGSTGHGGDLGGGGRGADVMSYASFSSASKGGGAESMVGGLSRYASLRAARQAPARRDDALIQSTAINEELDAVHGEGIAAAGETGDTALQDAIRNVCRGVFAETNPCAGIMTRNVTESGGELCFTTDFRRTLDRLLYRRMHLGGDEDDSNPLASVPAYLLEQLSRTDIMSAAPQYRKLTKYIMVLRMLEVPRGEFEADASAFASADSQIPIPRLTWEELEHLSERPQVNRIETEHHIRFKPRFAQHGLPLRHPGDAAAGGLKFHGDLPQLGIFPPQDDDDHPRHGTGVPHQPHLSDAFGSFHFGSKRPSTTSTIGVADHDGAASSDAPVLQLNSSNLQMLERRQSQLSSIDRVRSALDSSIASGSQLHQEIVSLAGPTAGTSPVQQLAVSQTNRSKSLVVAARGAAAPDGVGDAATPRTPRRDSASSALLKKPSGNFLQQRHSNGSEMPGGAPLNEDSYVEATVRQYVFICNHSKVKLPALQADTRYLVAVCGVLAPELPADYEETLERLRMVAAGGHSASSSEAHSASDNSSAAAPDRSVPLPPAPNASSSPPPPPPMSVNTMVSPTDPRKEQTTASHATHLAASATRVVDFDEFTIMSQDTSSSSTTPKQKGAGNPAAPAKNGEGDGGEKAAVLMAGSVTSLPFSPGSSQADGEKADGATLATYGPKKLQWHPWSNGAPFITNYVPKEVTLEYVDGDVLRLHLNPKLSEIEFQNFGTDPSLLSRAIASHMQQGLQKYVSGELSCLDDARFSKSALMERDPNTDAFNFPYGLKFDGRYQLRVRMGSVPASDAARGLQGGRQKSVLRKAATATRSGSSDPPADGDGAALVDGDGNAPSGAGGNSDTMSVASGAPAAGGGALTDGGASGGAGVDVLEEYLTFSAFGPMLNLVFCPGDVVDVEETEGGLRCYLHPPFATAHKSEFSMRARKNKLSAEDLGVGVNPATHPLHMRFMVTEDAFATQPSSQQPNGSTKRDTDAATFCFHPEVPRDSGTVMTSSIHLLSVGAYAVIGCSSTGSYSTHPICALQLRRHLLHLSALRPDSYNVSVKYLMVSSEPLPAWRFGGRIQQSNAGRARSRSATFEQPLTDVTPAGAPRRPSIVTQAFPETPGSNAPNELRHQDGAVVRLGRRATLLSAGDATAGGGKSPAPPGSKLSAVMSVILKAEENVLELSSRPDKRLSAGGLTSVTPKLVTMLHTSLKNGSRFSIGTGTVYRRHEALPLRVGETFVTLSAVASLPNLFDLFTLLAEHDAKIAAAAPPATKDAFAEDPLTSFLSASQNFVRRRLSSTQNRADDDGDLAEDGGRRRSGPQEEEDGDGVEGVEEGLASRFAAMLQASSNLRRSPIGGTPGSDGNNKLSVTPGAGYLTPKGAASMLLTSPTGGGGGGSGKGETSPLESPLAIAETLLGMHDCPFNEFAEPVFSRRGKPQRYPLLIPDLNLVKLTPAHDARMIKILQEYYDDQEKLQLHDMIMSGQLPQAFSAISGGASGVPGGTTAASSGGGTGDGNGSSAALGGSGSESSPPTTTIASNTTPSGTPGMNAAAAAMTGLATQLLKRGELSPWYQQFRRDIANVQVEVTVATEKSAKNAKVHSYVPQNAAAITIPNLEPNTEYRIRLRVQGRYSAALGSTPNWSRWTLPFRITTLDKIVISTTFATESAIILKWHREHYSAAADDEDFDALSLASSSMGDPLGKQHDAAKQKRQSSKGISLEARMVSGIADHRKFVPPTVPQGAAQTSDSASTSRSGKSNSKGGGASSRASGGHDPSVIAPSSGMSQFLSQLLTNSLPFEVEVSLIDNSDQQGHGPKARRQKSESGATEQAVLQQCRVFVPSFLHGLKLKDCFPGMKYVVRVRTTTNRECDVAISQQGATATAYNISPGTAAASLLTSPPTALALQAGADAQTTVATRSRRRSSIVQRQMASGVGSGVINEYVIGNGSWSPRIHISTLSDVIVTLLRVGASYCSFRIDKLAADLKALRDELGAAGVEPAAQLQLRSPDVTKDETGRDGSLSPRGGDDDADAAHRATLARMSFYGVRCRPAVSWTSEIDLLDMPIETLDAASGAGAARRLRDELEQREMREAGVEDFQTAAGFVNDDSLLCRWKRPTLQHSDPSRDVMSSARAGPVVDPNSRDREVTLDKLEPGVMYVLSIRPNIVGHFAGQWIEMLRFTTPAASPPSLVALCEDQIMIRWVEPFLRRVALLNQESARRLEGHRTQQLEAEAATKSHSKDTGSNSLNSSFASLAGSSSMAASSVFEAEGDDAKASALEHPPIPFEVQCVEIEVTGKFYDPSARRIGAALDDLKAESKDMTIIRTLPVTTRLRERLTAAAKAAHLQKKKRHSSSGKGAESASHAAAVEELSTALKTSSDAATPFFVIPAPISDDVLAVNHGAVLISADGGGGNAAVSGDPDATYRSTGSASGASQGQESSAAGTDDRLRLEGDPKHPWCVALELVVEHAFPDSPYTFRFRFLDGQRTWSPFSEPWRVLTQPSIRTHVIGTGESYAVLRMERIPRQPSSLSALTRTRDALLLEHDKRRVLERIRDTLTARLLVVERYGDVGGDEQSDDDAESEAGLADEDLYSKEQLQAELDLVSLELGKLRGLASPRMSAFTTDTRALQTLIRAMHADLRSRRARRYRFRQQRQTSSGGPAATPNGTQNGSKAPTPPETPPLHEMLGIVDPIDPIDDDRLKNPATFGLEVSVVCKEDIDATARPSRQYLFGRTGLLSTLSSNVVAADALTPHVGDADATQPTGHDETIEEAVVKRESTDLISISGLRPAKVYMIVSRVNSGLAERDADMDEPPHRSSDPQSASPQEGADGGVAASSDGTRTQPAGGNVPLSSKPLFVTRRCCSFFDPAVEVVCFTNGIWSDPEEVTTLPQIIVRCRAVGFHEVLFEVYRPLVAGESIPSDAEYEARSNTTMFRLLSSHSRCGTSNTYQLSVNGKHTSTKSLVSFFKGEKKLVHLCRLPNDSYVEVACRSKFSLDAFLAQLEQFPDTASTARNILRPETLAKRKKIVFWSNWVPLLRDVRTIPPRPSIPILYEARWMPSANFHNEGGIQEAPSKWSEYASMWWSVDVDSVNQFPAEIQMDAELNTFEHRRQHSRRAGGGSQTTAETTAATHPTSYLAQQSRLIQLLLDNQKRELNALTDEMQLIAKHFGPDEIISLDDPRGLNGLAEPLFKQNTSSVAATLSLRGDGQPGIDEGVTKPDEDEDDEDLAQHYAGQAFEGPPSELSFEVEMAEFWPELKCYSPFAAVGRFQLPFLRLRLPRLADRSYRMHHPSVSEAETTQRTSRTLPRCMFRIRSRVEAPTAPGGCVRSLWSPIVSWKAPPSPPPVGTCKLVTSRPPHAALYFDYPSALQHNQLVFEVVSRESDTPDVPNGSAVATMTRVTPFRSSPATMGPLRPQRYHHFAVRAVTTFGRSEWSRWFSLSMMQTSMRHAAGAPQGTDIPDTVDGHGLMRMLANDSSDWESTVAWSLPFPLPRTCDGFPSLNDTNFHFTPDLAERNSRRLHPEQVVVLTALPEFVAAGAVSEMEMKYTQIGRLAVDEVEPSDDSSDNSDTDMSNTCDENAAMLNSVRDFGDRSMGELPSAVEGSAGSFRKIPTLPTNTTQQFVPLRRGNVAVMDEPFLLDGSGGTTAHASATAPLTPKPPPAAVSLSRITSLNSDDGSSASCSSQLDSGIVPSESTASTSSTPPPSAPAKRGQTMSEFLKSVLPPRPPSLRDEDMAAAASRYLISGDHHLQGFVDNATEKQRKSLPVSPPPQRQQQSSATPRRRPQPPGTTVRASNLTTRPASASSTSKKVPPTTPLLQSGTPRRASASTQARMLPGTSSPSSLSVSAGLPSSAGGTAADAIFMQDDPFAALRFVSGIVLPHQQQGGPSAPSPHRGGGSTSRSPRRSDADLSPRFQRR